MYIYIYMYIYRGRFIREREELFRCTTSHMIHIKKSTYKIIYDSRIKSYMITDLHDFARDFKSCGKSCMSLFFRQYKSYMIMYFEKTPRILVKS